MEKCRLVSPTQQALQGNHQIILIHCFSIVFACWFVSQKRQRQQHEFFFGGFKRNFSGSFALVSRLLPFSINIVEFQLQLFLIIVLKTKPVSQILGVR